MDVFADLANLPHPIIAKAPAHTAEYLALADAAADGDQHDVFRRIIAGSDFPIQILSLLINRPQTAFWLRFLQDARIGRRRWRGFGFLILLGAAFFRLFARRGLSPRRQLR